MLTTTTHNRVRRRRVRHSAHSNADGYYAQHRKRGMEEEAVVATGEGVRCNMERRTGGAGD